MATEKFTIDETIAQTKSTFETLDTQRAEELENAHLMQQVNADVADKELARLVKKYGEQHPKVQKIQARQVYNKEMFVGLKQEIDRSNIKTEFLDTTSWRVHGRVYDSNAKPIKKLTVFLEDLSRKGSEILDYGCTDERGYYSITLNEQTVSEYEKQKTPVYLRVSDANKQIIFRSNEALQMSKGAVEYRDIFIVANDDCEMPNFNTGNPLT